MRRKPPLMAIVVIARAGVLVREVELKRMSKFGEGKVI